jgi:TolA-binding protein
LTVRADETQPTSADFDPESRADELLRLAKLLIAQNKIPGAVNYLKDLVSKYPNAEAASEGKTLLAKYQVSGKG